MNIVKLLTISFTLSNLAAAADFDGPNCKTQPPNQAITGCRYSPNSPPTAWNEPEEIEWSRDIKGARSGIVNLYVHGELEDLYAALTSAGWTRSLDQNRANNSAYVEAASKYQAHRMHVAEVDRLRKLLKKQKDDGENSAQTESQLEDAVNKDMELVQSMPVSNETLCGATQLAAFESDNSPLGGRHHLRIFATGRQDEHGQKVWAIVANRDTGIMFDLHRMNQGFLNHRIEANADYERDKVLVDLMIRKQLYGAPAFTKLALKCSPPPDKALSKDDVVVEVEIHR